MSTDPIRNPKEEDARLRALWRYDILDSPPEPAFDDITRLASRICETPVALVTFVDENRQWFKSNLGLDLKETDRALSFCSVGIEGETVLHVKDASIDPRFRGNPLVTGPPFIRFYAGAPLTTPDGHRIGAICAIDHIPRKLNENQIDALRILSRQVVTSLELRYALKAARASREALAIEMAQRAKVEESRRLAESFMRSTLDSLDEQIAILNSSGDIVHANAAWLKSVETGRPQNLLGDSGAGTNYLRFCEREAAAGSLMAHQLAAAIRHAFTPTSRKADKIEYACIGENENLYFDVQLSTFESSDKRYAVISHRDVTERESAHREIRSLNEELEQRVARRTSDLESANAKLHSSEQQLRSLFENASVGIVIGKANGEIVRVNDAFLTLTGESQRDLIGKNLIDRVHSDDRSVFAKQFQKIADGALPGFEMDVRCNFKSQPQTAWQNISLTAVHGQDGSAVTFVGLIQGLLDTKESELLRNMVFDRSVDMLVIADLNGRFRVSNKACTRILGYSGNELLEMNYFSIVHEDDVARARTELASLGRDEHVQLLDVRMRSKDGEYRDIVWNAAPWTDSQLFLGVGRDLTSIREAESLLREQDMMLQRAEQMAQMGSWHYQIEDRTVRCSNGIAAIVDRNIGSQPVDFDQLLNFLIEEDREILQQHILATAQDFVPRQTRCRVRRPDNTIRKVQTSIEVVRNSRGVVYGVIGACLDITDIDQTVVQLQESERQLRALTKRFEKIREDERTNISREIHDELGQKLTTLKFNLTLLSEDIVDCNERAMPAEDISAALQSMATVVDSTIMSVREIATQLRPEGLDAFGLVPAIRLHAREFARRTKVECRVEAPAEEALLSDDVRIALFRITQEAMTNIARHASASHVIVCISESVDSIELKVTDDGRGIECDDLASTRSLGVVGMRERATMVGGTFDIWGKKDGGTVVRVRIPQSASAQEPVAAHRASG